MKYCLADFVAFKVFCRVLLEQLLKENTQQGY